MSHSPFQLFDALPQHIEDALRASIDRFGVLVPVVRDQHGNTIDGHHRARIADELGVKYRIDVMRISGEDEAREIARTLNSDRRHLDEEQRRAVVADLRREGHSERAIAGALGVSKTTVHRDIEHASTGPGGPVQPERVKSLDGKERPATRPAPKPAHAPHSDADLLTGADWPAGCDTTSPLPDGPRHCKYCYEKRDLEIGEDGSLIVCSGCGAGLAPWDQAVAAGGYDAFIDEITERFAKEFAKRPTIVPAKSEREAERAQEALTSLGSDAPERPLDLKRAERMAREKAAEQRRLEPVAPVTTSGGIDLRHGDFRDVLDDIEPGTVDAIITDPPYPGEFVPLFSDLSRLAARILKPGGVLAVMCGQYYLPDYIERLSEAMRYRWCGAYIAQGPRTRVHASKVGTGWKPILIFSHQHDTYLGSSRPDVNGHFIVDDLFDSAGDDKRFHHWGQSESGMADLVERLSKPGDLICDPFLGGGTTAVVAKDLGRRFVGCDIDAGHVATSRERVA